MIPRFETLKERLVPVRTQDPGQRFFQWLCLLAAGISTCVVIPLDLFQDLGPWVDAVSLAFGLTALAIYLEARQGRYLKKTLLFSYMACLDLLWFPNGGSQGSVGLHFFEVGLGLVLFFRGRFRVAGLGLLVANITALLLAERAWPDLAHPFRWPSGRLLDLSTGYAISILVCCLMVWYVLGGLEREQARLRQALEEARGPVGGARVRLRVPDAKPAPRPTLSVLVVDDDEGVRRSLQAILEGLGHACAVAEGGAAALARIESGLRPDLVLLDMDMPGLDGGATLPRLRRLDSQVPVLLVTGRVDPAALALAASHPGVSLLGKPFSLKELEAHLDRPRMGESRKDHA